MARNSPTFGSPDLLKSFSALGLALIVCAFCGRGAVAAAITPAPPTTEARSHLLMDFHSGQILAEKLSTKRIEPASITKLMSAHVVFESLRAGTISLTDQVNISKKAWQMQGSRMFVEAGKSVSVEALLMGMIIQSGNDATVALAEFVAGSEPTFVQLMNQYAQEMGLTGSHFANSTGLPDKDHYMTAHDIALLTRATIREFPKYYEWYAEREYTYNNIKQFNRNRLLWRDESVDGVKTGHTESAGFCLVASAERDGMRLIAVVLGTNGEDERAREAEKLLNYGFRFYETHQLYKASEPLTTAHVWKGERAELPLGLADDLAVTIPRGSYKELDAAMTVEAVIIAPSQRGQALGTLEVSLDGKPIAQRPLISLQDIAEGGLFTRLIDEVQLWFY